MHNMYIIGKKTELKLSLLGANNRNLIVHIIVSGAQLNHIYSCPMKTHRSSDVHSCGISNAVQNCVAYIYYFGQMQCFRTKISIPVTPLTHDVTSVS